MNGSEPRRNGRSKRGNGEGSIYRRQSDGRWVGAVVGPDGRRRYFYGKRRSDVLVQVSDAAASARTGFAPETGATVKRILDVWLAATRPTVRESTFVSYEGHVRMHLAPLHPIRASQLRPDHLRSLQDSLLAEGLSARTVGYTNTVLRMALKQAVADGILHRNVALLVKPPRKPGPAIKPLQAGELSCLIWNTHDPVRRALWAVCGGLGLRLGEALGLRWPDVNWGHGTLAVHAALRPIPCQARGQRLRLVEPKTARSQRTLVMPAFVSEALQQVPRRGVFLFTTPRGTPLDPRNTLRHLKLDLAALDLPEIRIHDLRHTAATIMLASGTDLQTVRETLGHSSIASTAIYAHVVPAMRRNAAERMDMAVVGNRADKIEGWN